MSMLNAVAKYIWEKSILSGILYFVGESSRKCWAWQEETIYDL